MGNPRPRARADAGKAVAQVMDPDVFNACSFTHGTPGTIEIGAWLLILLPRGFARDYVEAEAGYGFQNGESRCGQHHGLLARFRIRQEEQPTASIVFRPADV